MRDWLIRYPGEWSVDYIMEISSVECGLLEGEADTELSVFCCVFLKLLYFELHFA